MIILNSEKPSINHIDLFATGALKIKFGETTQIIDTPHTVVDRHTNVYSLLIEHCLLALPKKFSEFKFSIQDEFVMAFIPRCIKHDQTIHHNYPKLLLTITPTLSKLELQDKSCIIQKGQPNTALKKCFTLYQMFQSGNKTFNNEDHTMLMLT